MNKIHLSIFIMISLMLIDTTKVASQGYFQEKDKNLIMSAVLGSGFKENERILLYYVNSHGERKTLYSGMYHRVNQNENVFTSKITGKHVNRLEVYALDRNQSISYSFISKNSPVVKLTVSISKSGFHILYSDN